MHKLALWCTRIALLIGRPRVANPMQMCHHGPLTQVVQPPGHRDFCKTCFEDVMALLYNMES